MGGLGETKPATAVKIDYYQLVRMEEPGKATSSPRNQLACWDLEPIRAPDFPYYTHLLPRAIFEAEGTLRCVSSSQLVRPEQLRRILRGNFRQLFAQAGFGRLFQGEVGDWSIMSEQDIVIDLSLKSQKGVSERLFEQRLRELKEQGRTERMERGLKVILRRHGIKPEGVAIGIKLQGSLVCFSFTFDERNRFLQGPPQGTIIYTVKKTNSPQKVPGKEKKVLMCRGVEQDLICSVFRSR